MSVLSHHAYAHTHIAPQAASSDEAATARLIAELLSQDLEQERSFQHAQQIQYHLALSDSRPGSPTLPLRPPIAPEDDDDHLAALRLALDAVQSSISIATVDGLEELRTRQQADEVAAKQLALTFEAAARRERLDAEFARALQKNDDDGRDIDAQAAREVEKVLGEARVRELMSPPTPLPVPQPKLQAQAPVHPQPRRNPFPYPAHEFVRAENARLPGTPVDAKGKGKAPATPTTVVDSLTTCRICFEPCHLTASPFAAALSATSSNRVQFGMHVGDKAHGHAYCIGCLVAYIQSKIEDTNAAKVFPIACPECTHELTDDLAARVLGPSNLEGWHYRKLLDSMPALFCPNVRCSARVVRDTDGDSQAECPSCHKTMCCECKTAWHPGYSCAAFQALPPEARDPEDFSILRLADEQGWRRCPSCKAVIELESGCYHMTCACGGHFCFVCSGPWNQRTKRCAKNPPCDLWNEANLIVGRDRHAGERRRARDAQHFENDRILPRANLLPAPGHVPNHVAAEVQEQQRQRDEAANAARRRRELAQFQAEMREWELEREENTRREADEAEDEDYEEEERRREEEDRQLEWDRQQAAYYAPAPDRNQARQYAMQRLEWLSHVNGSTHAFTAEFLQRECGYCQDRFNSIHDLQQHLATTTRHRVYTCCGKFFRVQPHLHQHLDSRSANQHDPFET